MKKILISGFEPFDQDLVNPSEEWLKFAAKRSTNHHLTFQLLPVEFENSSKILLEKINDTNPDIVIMLGFAKNRTKISFEKVALNWVDARIPDNIGRKIVARKIIESNALAYFTQINVESFLEKLNNDFFELSYTAGTYVCNYLYYLVLNEVKMDALFIHLPGKSKRSFDEIFLSLLEFIELL